MVTYYQEALKYKGTPYRLGGMDRAGIDCSGLVNVVTGQKTRVWHTGAGTPPPGNWSRINIRASSHDDFIRSLKRGDLLVWKGHAAFFDSGERIFHARRVGTVADFTNDLKLYWLKTQGYPVVYRQK